MSGGQRRSRLRTVMLVLLVEKVIQHIAVTVAFGTNFDAIRDSVAVPWATLAVVGAALAALYAVAFRRYRRGRPRALVLIAALALADIVGEFVAQGTPAIAMNVSFIVALALLTLVVIERRRATRAG